MTGAHATHGRPRPQGAGLLWAAGAASATGGGPDVAPVCRRAPGACGHHGFSGVVLRSIRGARLHSLAIDLGQRVLAPQPRRATLDSPAQSAGQTGRGRGALRGLPVAQQKPVAQLHRTKMGPWEADRLLSADELEARVSAYYGCQREAPLVMPKKVA